MGVFEPQSSKLGDLSKEVIGLHFYSLNNTISEDNNGSRLRAQQLLDNATEGMSVVEVCSNIICPARSTIAALLGVTIANHFNGIGQFRHVEGQGDWLRLAHSLPE